MPERIQEMIRAPIQEEGHQCAADKNESQKRLSGLLPVHEIPGVI
jgi:hypothetical protein